MPGPVPFGPSTFHTIMSIQLQVSAPPAGNPEGANIVHTYDDVTLLKQAQTFSTDYSFGKVTQPNASFNIPNAFLGVTSYFDLPEGDWRCRVTFNGVEVLNGRCRRDGTEYDSVSGTFVVACIDDSTDKAKTALKDVRLIDLPEDVFDTLSASSVGTRVLVHYETRPDTTRSSKALSRLKPIDFVNVYPVLKVLQACFSAAELLGAPTEMYDAVTRYTVSGTAYEYRRPVHDHLMMFSFAGYSSPLDDKPLAFETTEYVRNSLTLPTWDGWTMTEQFLKLTAQTFRAAYGAFPSEQITVDLIPDTWAETAGLPEIDGAFTPGGYTLHREDADLDGLSVEFERVKDQPDVVTWGSGWDYVVNDDPQIDIFHTPPPFATRAAERWVFDTDGKPISGEKVDLKFALASAGHVGAGSFITENSNANDGAGHVISFVNLYANPVISALDDDTCYLFMRRPTTGEMLVHRRVVNAAPGQMPVVNESWANNIFANYRLSRAKRETVEGEVIASGAISEIEIDAFRVGSLAEGFEFAGLPWLAGRVERKAGTGTLGLRGIRPVSLPSPITDQPYRTGAVSDLKGENVDVENGISPEKEYHRIEWNWPADPGGRATCFDIERYNFGSGVFVGFVGRTYARRIFDFTYSQGDDVNGQRHSVYRVRAVMDERDGIADTLGPWTEVIIYF